MDKNWLRSSQNPFFVIQSSAYCISGLNILILKAKIIFRKLEMDLNISKDSGILVLSI